jgi:hypothetical protein
MLISLVRKIAAAEKSELESGGRQGIEPQKLKW